MATTLTRLPLAASVEAAAQARHAVRDELGDSPREVADQACLLVDELVSSTLAAGTPFELLIERHPAQLVVEVLHQAAADEQVADRLGPAEAMLDGWASRWGTTDDSRGRSIWFSIATG